MARLHNKKLKVFSMESLLVKKFLRHINHKYPLTKQIPKRDLYKTCAAIFSFDKSETRRFLMVLQYKFDFKLNNYGLSIKEVENVANIQKQR